MALELYMDGVLDYREYALLAAPSELHPDYEKTIGALTGRRAAPDWPRDLVADWETRVHIETNHGTPGSNSQRRSERILAVLKSMDRPVWMVV